MALLVLYVLVVCEINAADLWRVRIITLYVDDVLMVYSEVYIYVKASQQVLLSPTPHKEPRFLDTTFTRADDTKRFPIHRPCVKRHESL